MLGGARRKGEWERKAKQTKKSMVEWNLGAH